MNKTLQTLWNEIEQEQIKFYEKLLGESISLSNSRRHSANAEVIANVKSKIIVSCRHFFADMIFSATSKVQNYQNKIREKSLKTQTNRCLLQTLRDFKDIFKHISFTLYL